MMLPTVSQTLIVALISGFVALLVAAFGFKYRLNGIIDDQNKIRQEARDAHCKAEETQSTVSRHADRLARIETRCELLHKHKGD